MAELINFHCVFDALNINGNFYDVFDAIEAEILGNYKELQSKFDISDESKLALMKLAKSDRKRFNINKILSQPTTKKVYKELFEKEFIVVEKSLEKPIKQTKNRPLKKYLRRYQVEDKIRFKDNFTKFWFHFIEPNLTMLEYDKSKNLMQLIRAEFDDYASFSFELLCRELMAFRFKVSPQEVSSLWTRDVEIDLFLRVNSQTIVGEAKFKEHKTCKNVLTLLIKKCDKIGLEVDKFMLFSKSGFSKELEKIKDDKIALCNIEDFEELL